MNFYLDRYNTFIFDFDGTIADTLPLCFDSFRQVFLTFNNEEMSDDNIESWFGPSEIGIIENNLKNKEDSKRAVDLYYDLYKKNHSSFVKQKKKLTLYSRL